MRTSLSTLALVALALAGCDTSDPRKGGFVGGLGGLASGSYEQRVAARRAEVGDLAEAERALDRRLAGARATADRLDRRIATLSAEIATLRARQAMLDAATGGTEAQRVERDHLRQALFALTARNAARNRMQAELRGERGATSVADRELDGDEELARRLLKEQAEQLARLN